MQMDAYLKKEQIGTIFVWVGAPEGGVRGWVVGQRGPAQLLGMPVQNNLDASCHRSFIHTVTSTSTHRHTRTNAHTHTYTHICTQ